MKKKPNETRSLIEDADWVRRMAELENNGPISVGGFLRFLPPDEAQKIIDSNRRISRQRKSRCDE